MEEFVDLFQDVRRDANEGDQENVLLYPTAT